MIIGIGCAALLVAVLPMGCSPRGSPRAAAAAHPPERGSLQDRIGHDSANTECPTTTPRFADYQADSIYRGQPGPVDRVAANRVMLWGASYSTAANVDSTLAHGANFAGRYTVVDSHCGAACEKQTIIDTKTGRLLLTLETGLGADFRLDSRLFIANPVDSAGCYQPHCAYCRPVYYVWDGVRLDSIW